MVSPTAKAGVSAADMKGRFEALAKLGDGKIDQKEQKILQELQSAFQNLQDPNIKALIGKAAQQMGLAGAQQAARMASGGDAQAAAQGAATTAGGAADPLRCNSCNGGQGAGASGAAGSSDASERKSSAGNSGSGAPALGGKGGMMFEDMVAQFLFDVIKEMQAELKKKMAQYKTMSKSKGGGGGGGKGAAGGAGGGEDSRQLMFEEIKNMMQKMQQMIQSLSNILNTMHQGAMNSIRNIRV